MRTDALPPKILSRNRHTEPSGPTEGTQERLYGGRDRAKRSKRSEMAMRAGTTLHVKHLPNKAKLAATLPAVSIGSTLSPTESYSGTVKASGADGGGWSSRPHVDCLLVVVGMHRQHSSSV